VSRPSTRRWLVVATSLYVGLSVLWLLHLIPEPLLAALSKNLRLLFLLGPPLALAKATNATLLCVYLLGTLVCGWLLRRSLRTQTPGKRLANIVYLLFAWSVFGLLASAPYF
jgi:uncharacterized membrane protein YqjE